MQWLRPGGPAVVPDDNPRALILSGSIGNGHDSVAAACAEGLYSVGVSSTTLDCMGLLGGPGQRLGELVFRKALSSPSVFDAVHFSQFRAGSRLARLVESSAARHIVPRIRDRLPPNDEGLILSVFASGAGAAARVTADLHGWRTAVLCTDAAAHRLWVHPGVDRYLVCSTMTAATVQQYDPHADVVVLPPPVRGAFFEAPDQPAARRALELPDDERRYVLLTAGGWGFAPLADIAGALAKSGYVVLAVAGHNHDLEGQLRAVAAAVNRRSTGQVVPYGFTPRMPDLIAASDAVVTAAGQTCHESRVVGRPLIVLDVIPGHGRENVLLELMAGGARASLAEPQSVVQAVDAVWSHGISPTDPWPVTSAAQWHRMLAEALAGLLPGRSRPQPARSSQGPA